MTFTMTPQEAYWISKAENGISDDGFKLWMVGGGVGAVGAAVFFNPFVGGLLALASFTKSWEANELACNDLDAIDKGILAHLLEPRDFEDYLEYRGPQNVLWELMEAQRRKLEIKPAGRKFLKGHLGQKTLIQQAKALVTPAQHSTPAPKPQPVEAPHASPAPITAQWEAVAPPFLQKDESTGWQPADLPQPFIPYLASQIHILIAATTGSGKTWVLRNLCTHLANQGHLITIADPKGSDWESLKPAARFMQSDNDYLKLFDQINAELTKRKGRLNQGQPVGKHLWFVFDEWMLAKGKLAWLEKDEQKLITTVFLDLIVAGRELNMHMILVNQSHLLGDISLSPGKNTLSSGLRDNICTLALGCKMTKDHEGKPMEGNAKTIDNVLTDDALIRAKTEREAAQSHHTALRSQPEVNRTFAVHASRLFVGQTPELEIPPLNTLGTFPESEVAVAPETMSEVKQLILAILEAKGNTPMLASEIRQQSASLKKLTTDQVAFALDRMAVDDGFVVSDGESPARYQIP